MITHKPRYTRWFIMVAVFCMHLCCMTRTVLTSSGWFARIRDISACIKCTALMDCSFKFGLREVKIFGLFYSALFSQVWNIWLAHVCSQHTLVPFSWCRLVSQSSRLCLKCASLSTKNVHGNTVFSHATSCKKRISAHSGWKHTVPIESVMLSLRMIIWLEKLTKFLSFVC